MPEASSYCPLCGKKLQAHSSVAFHTSQPLSGCNTWLNDLIQLEQSSCSLPEDHPMEVDNIAEPYIFNSYELVEFMDSGDIFNEGESVERTPQDKIQDESSEVTNHFSDPPLAFEYGYTFLSIFDSDKNSIYLVLCKAWPEALSRAELSWALL
ncbi:hypothetical protein P692DRAFT_20758864 [Suillus brevipes Sb2]|nr:hypothetical protein P692DRAFT_20758864 [Suillus brevipes Sb2]